MAAPSSSMTVVHVHGAHPSSDAHEFLFYHHLSSARIELFIETFRGQTIRLDVCVDDTIDELQTQIEQNTGIPRQHQHLCLAGHTLEGPRRISECNIDECTVLTMQWVVTPSAPARPKELQPMPPLGPPSNYCLRSSGCSSSQEANSSDVPTPPPQASKRSLEPEVATRGRPPTSSKRQKHKADKQRQQKDAAVALEAAAVAATAAAAAARRSEELVHAAAAAVNTATTAATSATESAAAAATMLALAAAAAKEATNLSNAAGAAMTHVRRGC